MTTHADTRLIDYAIEAAYTLPGFLAGYTCSEISKVVREHTYASGQGYNALSDRGRERLREIITYCETYHGK